MEEMVHFHFSTQSASQSVDHPVQEKINNILKESTNITHTNKTLLNTIDQLKNKIDFMEMEANRKQEEDSMKKRWCFGLF